MKIRISLFSIALRITETLVVKRVLSSLYFEKSKVLHKY